MGDMWGQGGIFRILDNDMWGTLVNNVSIVYLRERDAKIRV